MTWHTCIHKTGFSMYGRSGVKPSRSFKLIAIMISRCRPASPTYAAFIRCVQNPTSSSDASFPYPDKTILRQYSSGGVKLSPSFAYRSHRASMLSPIALPFQLPCATNRSDSESREVPKRRMPPICSRVNQPINTLIETWQLTVSGAISTIRVAIKPPWEVPNANAWSIFKACKVAMFMWAARRNVNSISHKRTCPIPESQYVHVVRFVRVLPWPKGSIAIKLATLVSPSSSNWAVKSSAVVPKELMRTNVG